MTLRAAPADRPAPRKRGPKTPEGKARSAMNALKHGLRARSFGLLPEESRPSGPSTSPTCAAVTIPVDEAEEKLVTAIAVAMWNEIRADRTLVETMAEIPPRRPGRRHGTDMAEPEHARSLGTALRYLTAAGMATQRAQRAFLVHRKAKQAGLILRAAARPSCRRQNCTNELPAAVGGPRRSADDGGANERSARHSLLSRRSPNARTIYRIRALRAASPSQCAWPPRPHRSIATSAGGARRWRGRPGAGRPDLRGDRGRNAAPAPGSRYDGGMTPPIARPAARRLAGRCGDRRACADGDPGSPVPGDGRWWPAARAALQRAPC